MKKRFAQSGALLLLSLVFPIVLIQEMLAAWSAGAWSALLANLFYFLLWLGFAASLAWLALTSDAPQGLQTEDRGRRTQSIRYGFAALREMSQGRKRR